jgi:hypothetical protein
LKFPPGGGIVIQKRVNDFIDLSIAGFPFTVRIPAGVYATPEALALAIFTALETTGFPGWVCSFADGRFTLGNTTTFIPILFLFSTGPNVGNDIGPTLGFTPADFDVRTAEGPPLFGIDGAVEGVDPQVMLRFSNDGGKTWGTELMRSTGKVGEYGKRVRWERLGRARRRVFEISTSDPVPYRITGAAIELGQPVKGAQQQRQAVA